jgi:polyisoprenoid-binding protein YceI
MNRHVVPTFLLVSALLWLPLNPAQADNHYALDKAHTAISYSVDSFLGLSDISGTFAKYDGDFVFCTQHPDKDRISITLYSSGIRTPDGERDEEIQGPHFFNAAEFPEIHFISTKVTLVNNNDADVDGNLTLLGVTKPVMMHVHFLQTNAEPGSDDYVVDFSASGVIERSDFGMTYLDPIIGDEVLLRIEAKGMEKDAHEPAETAAPHDKTSH